MGSFTEALRAQVGKALGQTSLWGDVNPLVVIGLSEAILDLGLTEDQIYAAIRSYGRQLAAQVHPDRKPENVSPERQRQILGAFDLLDNRENFTRALAHFKTIRAEDRRESRLLSQTLSVLKERVTQYEERAQTFSLDQERLDQEKSQIAIQKVQHTNEIQQLEYQNKMLGKRVENQKAQMKSLLEKAPPWKKRFERAMAKVVNLGSEQKEGIFTFEAKWVAIVSAWPERVTRSAPPSNCFDEEHEKFGEAIDKLKIQSQKAEILSAWREVVLVYGGKYHYGTEANQLEFSLIKLRNGTQELLYGQRLGVSGRRVVGCILRSEFWAAPLDKESQEDKIERERQQLRSCLRANMSYDFILPSMSSYLVPGSLLVAVSADSRRKAAWSLTCPEFKFSTRRMILAVG